MNTRFLAATLTLLLTACTADVVDQHGDSQPSGGHDPEATSCTITKTLLFPSDPEIDLGGQCLEQAPLTLASGEASCVAINGRKTGGACSCDAALGRAAVEPKFADVEAKARASAEAQQSGWDCFCEIVSLQGAAGAECQNKNDSQASGLCYVDPTTTPQIGNPELAKVCPDDEQHLIRFSGLAGTPVEESGQNEGYFMSCDVACD